MKRLPILIVSVGLLVGLTLAFSVPSRLFEPTRSAEDVATLLPTPP